VDPSRIIIGDVIDGLRTLDDGSVQCCVTSPPYWGLRDYGVEGQIGLEKTPDEFVAKMVDVFCEVRRVLRDDGVMFLNLGDSYANNGVSNTSTVGGFTGERIRSGAKGTMDSRPRNIPDGLKPKDLCMIPWRVALALQADGWWLRSVICWAKKSPMPESVTDRPTSSWEPIFLLAKSERYFYDAEAVKEAAVKTGTDAHLRGGSGERAGTRGGLRGAVIRKAANGSTLGGGAYGRDALGDAIPEKDRRAQVEGEDVFVEASHTRNQRNVWHLGPEPYPESHFAVFPTEIPRRAIKAGTSEKGCCAACGAPWARVVERKNCDRTDASEYAAGLGDVATARTRTACNFRNGITTSVGWEPGCTCGADVVPCMVLDPFLGSGTTVAVARELGRYGVGCELNPEYAKLARDRIGKAEKPATFRSDRVIDSPLFGGNECPTA